MTMMDNLPIKYKLQQQLARTKAERRKIEMRLAVIDQLEKDLTAIVGDAAAEKK